MKLYLDMCALKRPFDDQTQARVASETQSMIAILDRIERELDTFVWSSALTLENEADPDDEARLEVAKLAGRAAAALALEAPVEARIRVLCKLGVRPLDAAHMAFAESAGCDALITCDDRFLRRARSCGNLIRVINPIEYTDEVGHD